jgi:hypothetical protein
LTQNRIVCNNDIFEIIKDNPNVTSDTLAAKLSVGIRLQDVLLDIVKESVVLRCPRCGKSMDPSTMYDYEGESVCRTCFIQLIPQEGRDMMLNPSDEGGIPWEELGDKC